MAAISVPLLETQNLRFSMLMFKIVRAGKVDPYVTIQYRSQERKSSIKRGMFIYITRTIDFLVTID
jgi:hypothetical protein